MKKTTLPRILLLAPPAVICVLVLSQWLGGVAWRIKVNALLTWADDTRRAPVGAILESPYRPDAVYYLAPRANDATGSVELVYQSNRFRWLSLINSNPSYDCVVVSIRLNKGQLEVDPHYGSD